MSGFYNEDYLTNSVQWRVTMLAKGKIKVKILKGHKT